MSGGFGQKVGHIVGGAGSQASGISGRKARTKRYPCKAPYPIGFLGVGIFQVFCVWSLELNLLLATLALLLGWAVGQVTLAIAFTIGLASHLVADLCTLELPLLKPFSRRCFSLLPPEKRVAEGYMGEWLIMVVSSLLAIGLLLFLYLPRGGIL